MLCKDGAAQVVVVDDWLPVVKGSGRPAASLKSSTGASSGNVHAFSSSRIEGELWVSLLEKACAKVAGSYHELQSQLISSTLYALVGADSRCVVEEFPVQESLPAEIVDEGEVDFDDLFMKEDIRAHDARVTLWDNLRYVLLSALNCLPSTNKIGLQPTT